MADSSPSEQVAALADEFLDRHRRGERPDLGEYLARYPHLAAEIRDVFPAVAMMENVAIGDATLGGATATAAPPHPQVGDFRIVREVGRGGMGVVYEAEQMSLGRFVALKLLPSSLTATGQERQRFLREAKAAAKLHHTNIVPVFGFGEADGTPYYAMQFIRGQGLDAVIEELKGQTAGAGAAYGDTTVTRAANLARSLATGAFDSPEDTDATAALAPGQEPKALPKPTAETGALSRTAVTSRPNLSGVSAVKPSKYTLVRGIARIGLQVAQALDHAHGQGVLHRDIKPSNLLLDTYGTVWVTDFGLAKAEGLPDITRAGDLLGTLRYMPPEAFDGRFDARGDVYALGLTLFELLALRPAFDESDRRKLIKLVSEGSAPQLRKLAPEVPRDLATIVQKAIQKDPARRYQTAAALADDLQRFLADRPITARPISAIEHGWRACRRNPVLSGMGAAALLGLVVGLGGALWGRAVAQDGEANANYQKSRAEQNEQLARTAAAAADRNATAANENAQKAEKAADALRDERDEIRKLNARIEAQKLELADRLYVSDMVRAKALLDAGGSDIAADLLSQYRPAAGQRDRRGPEWFCLNRLTDTAEVRADLRARGEALAFSPAGDLLAVAVSDKVVLLRSDTGAEVRSFPFDTKKGLPRRVAFTPDGKQLILLVGAHLTEEGTAELRVWDVAGAARVTLPLDTKAYEVAARRQTGELFVSCHDGTVRVFDTGNWKETAQLKKHDGPAIGVAVSADGAWVASGGMDGKVRLWPRSGGAPTVLDGRGPTAVLHFRPDGKQIVTSRWGGEVLFWDLTVTPPKLASTAATGFGALVVSPDAATLASSGRDGAVRFFDTATRRETDLIRAPGGDGSAGGLLQLAFRPDGKYLAGVGTDRSVRLWNLATAFDAQVLRGGTDLRTVALSPDGKTVASGSPKPDSKLRVYRADTGALVKELAGHAGGGVRRIKFSPDGKWAASVGDDGALVFRDTKDWAERPEWSLPCLPKRPPNDPYYVGACDLDFTPDGRKLVVCTWNGALVHEFDPAGDRLKRVRTWQVPEDGRVWFVAYSPDGKKVATTIWAHDKQRDFVIVWDVAGEKVKELFRLAAPVGSVGAVAFSPDGKEIAGGCVDAVRFWDAGTGRPLAKRLRGYANERPTYTRDGSRIVTAGRAVCVWDANTGDELLALRGHTLSVSDVSVSADAQRIASAGTDQTIRIWDAPRK